MSANCSKPSTTRPTYWPSTAAGWCEASSPTFGDAHQRGVPVFSLLSSQPLNGIVARIVGYEIAVIVIGLNNAHRPERTQTCERAGR